jgi:tetratricopeptide (TPR) repeat protein
MNNNEDANSLVKSEIGIMFFLQEEYGQAERFLLDALQLNPSNHIVWHYLGLLFTEGDRRSYEAENCHHRVLWVTKKREKEDGYIESSREFLVRLGFGNPDGMSPFPECNLVAARNVREFLLDLPRDLPRLGDSRIPLFQRDEELFRPSYLGNPSCINNARSPYLQCVINPTGDCSDCKDYREIVEEL